MQKDPWESGKKKKLNPEVVKRKVENIMEKLPSWFFYLFIFAAIFQFTGRVKASFTVHRAEIENVHKERWMNTHHISKTINLDVKFMENFPIQLEVEMEIKEAPNQNSQIEMMELVNFVAFLSNVASADLEAAT